MDNSRRNSRREDTRRHSERRVITDEFGSKEWLKKIKEHYFLYPKHDQRIHARREAERRELERRQENSNVGYLPELLTDEERQLLSEIWAS